MVTGAPQSTMTTDEARRLALRAQGIDRPRPTGRVDRRHLRAMLDRVSILQIDSVNVLSRAHYVPAFSRFGAYDRSTLDAMAGRRSELFEYWAHVASLLPVDVHPLLRWRMDEGHAWGGPRRVAQERPDLVAAVEAEVLASGPIAASAIGTAIGEGTGRTEAWWGWNDTKSAVEYLFATGRISAKRSPTFERLYCAPDLAVPRRILDAPTPTERDAKRELVRLAARAHGVGTARDLADVWRLKTRETAELADELVADGVLETTAVDGWRDRAYRDPAIPLPRAVDVAALVSPFDSLMWERDRVARLHDFDYRIEIYVPAAKRRYGYYVYPFLLGDRYVARVDLKADRKAGRLLVRAAWAEPDLAARDTDTDTVARALARELTTLATWLDLQAVEIEPKGDLAPHLAKTIT